MPLFIGDAMVAIFGVYVSIITIYQSYLYLYPENSALMDSLINPLFKFLFVLFMISLLSIMCTFLYRRFHAPVSLNVYRYYPLYTYSIRTSILFTIILPIVFFMALAGYAGYSSYTYGFNIFPTLDDLQVYFFQIIATLLLYILALCMLSFMLALFVMMSAYAYDRIYSITLQQRR
jgi:hypothetical protein